MGRFLSHIRFVVVFFVCLLNELKPNLVGCDVCCLQAFLELRHENEVEHIFVVGNSGKQFEIILVKFLGLPV